MKTIIRLKKNRIQWISMVMAAALLLSLGLPAVQSRAAVNSFLLAHYTNTGLASLLDDLDEKGKRPGEGIVVAVIDTGLYSKADQYFDNLWYNETEKNGAEGVDDDGNGYVDDICGVSLANSDGMKDSDGHGTQVAGIIGMYIPESDIRGVAYGAKVMPIRVSTDRNYDEDDVIEAIEYAVDNGADIINMSFATYRYSEKLENAVRKASEKCVMVAAAGNESYATVGPLKSEDLTEEGKEQVYCHDAYPASWDCCIGVMSYGNNDELAYFSNWDQGGSDRVKYDIIAPGENIYTLTNGGKFVNVKGTSFSTPYVSAAVAIYMSLTGQKDPSSVKEGFLSLINRNCIYRQAGYVFSFPRLSFDGLKSLTVSGNSTEDTVSGNSTDDSEGGEVSGQDQSGTDTNTGKQNAGDENTGGKNTETVQGSGKGCKQDDPPEGIGCPEQGSGDELPSKTGTEIFKKPVIKKVKQTSKKLTITIKNLPQTGKTTLRIYKKNKLLYKVTVKKSKVVIKRKKLAVKGKIKLQLSYKKGKTVTKSGKTIKLGSVKSKNT